MQLYESRLNHFNDKARINYCKSRSVHQHGGPSRPRQNCHSCIFETKETIHEFSVVKCCFCYLNTFEFKHDSYLVGDLSQEVSCLS